MASDALVPAEQALIKHLNANHDKAQLEAARTVLESVTALFEENDFWKRQMGNTRQTGKIVRQFSIWWTALATGI